MAVPKRRHSKSRTRKKRNSHYTRKVTVAVKTKDKKGYKRPHVEEYVEI
ncbi:50S ribosomal protein L32 [candidate division WWE3 bacterium]|jgi:ribosomal protein L32|uniref:Large ribosomal subunit protein bL32 n=1 Tax=candidate division WWE3 bacterium TaxID=2053526 RepID=A0A3A4ZDU4_UNCKA|nr:MAG: 50S ribosomal protein L32 [candidate division WWE3 bacterium]